MRQCQLVLQPAEGANPPAHHATEQRAEDHQHAQHVQRHDCIPGLAAQRPLRGYGTVLYRAERAAEDRARAGPAVQPRHAKALGPGEEIGVHHHQGRDLDPVAPVYPPRAAQCLVAVGFARVGLLSHISQSARCTRCIACGPRPALRPIVPG